MRELLRLVGAALAALLTAYPLSLSGDQRVGLCCVLAGGAAVNALVLWSDGAVTAAAGAFVGAYAAGLYIGDVGLDPLAPVYAGTLLVFVEVADTALGVPALRAIDRAVLLALARSCLRVLGLALVAGVAVLGGSQLVRTSSGALRVLAMAAAVGAVALPFLLARGETESGTPPPRT